MSEPNYTADQLANMSATDMDQLLRDYDLNPDKYRDYFHDFDPQSIQDIQDNLSRKLSSLSLESQNIAGRMKAGFTKHRGELGTLGQSYRGGVSARGLESATDLSQRFQQQKQELFSAQTAAHKGFKGDIDRLNLERGMAQTAADIDIRDEYEDYDRYFSDRLMQVEDRIALDKANEGESCFYGNSKVVLENGTIKKVKDIEYGDMVQSFDSKGNIIYSKVVKDMFFNTKDSKNKYYYTIIKAGGSKLRVTARHKIFVNGIKKTKKARYVHPGDEINIVQNGALKSVKVDSVEHKMMKGKYDLFTEEGSVIVDNVGCTIFDGPLPHKLALWGWKVANKFRWFYNLNYLWYKPLYKLTTNEPA
tara:strand:- start:953 stop:2038 length:1086 start_codon:yes stop_codon:yes gene_type:complete